MRQNKTRGMVLALFILLATLWPVATLAQNEVTCASDVTVEAGEWLSIIAERELGNPLLYPAIAEATNLAAQTDDSYATIGDNDVIEPGWKLCIPSPETIQALIDSPATATTASPAADPSTLTVDELANATYGGIYEEQDVTLTEGRYEGEPFVAGGAARPTVTFDPRSVTLGDLNGDGAEDAVALLGENSGGSGYFVYLAAAINQAGQPVNTGTTLLPGDGPQLKSMVIDNGQIVLEIVTQGPDDPQCCPSLVQRKTYALQQDQLVEVSSEDLGSVSLADLNDTSWTLVDFNFDQQPVSAENPITLNFTADRVSGSAGCNNYNAPIDGAGDFPQSLTIGLAATTRKLCPPPTMALETQYLTALEDVRLWGYVGGHLGLSYENEEGGLNTLLFRPQATGETATPSTLSLEQLANATYSGIYDEPVSLINGEYEGEPFVPDGAARPRVTLVQNAPIPTGDLNGDGALDSVVFLVENSGGSGTFTYVGAMLNQEGQPVDGGTVWVGDRTQVKSVTIEEGQIVMEIVTQGPDDPQCCPTLVQRKTYAWQDGQLTEISSEDVGPISGEALNGTSWSLVYFNFDQESVLDGTEITVNFADGRVAGSGGCNSYTAGYETGGDTPQAIDIGPAAATLAACAPPVMQQEMRFFNALETASQWGYQIGQLVLTYENAEGGLNSLVFAPQLEAMAEADSPQPTEVVTFVPTEIPTETQTGSCFTNAIGLGRADAYRCTVGNQIYDPCFVTGEEQTVVCGANPATGETGFVLELTESLPEPDVNQPGKPWLIELADGQICGLMTGTVPGVADRIAPYGCPDQTYLFEDFQQGEVWQAEKAAIGLNDDGFFIESSEMVPITRVWQ